MKKILLFIVVSVQPLLGQNITGSWSGELNVQSMKLPLVINIFEKEGILTSTLDSPKQGAKGLPVKETIFDNRELSLDAPALGLKYKGILNEAGEIHGSLSQNGMTFPLILKKGAVETVVELKRPQTPKPPYAYYTEDVTFKNETEGNLLAGTLAAPGEGKDFPVMVMITGSGAQNRDEELFGHKPFLIIADYLAKQGIGTLRLDDRGVGGSEPGKPGATSEDFAGDISSAVNFLAARGYTNIGLIGHSEGGMIAPMVNVMNNKLKFMVLMAGPGIPITELMKLQTYEVSKAAGVPEEQAKAAVVANSKLYTFINNYKGDDLETDLRVLMQKEMPGLPEAQLESSVKQVANPWFRYFLAFDPDKYLSQAKVPVLAINGSLDTQVTSGENLEGIRRSLTRAGNKKFDIMEFENLNHLFQTAKTGSPAEYGTIEETISPKVLEKIGTWVKSLDK